MIKNQCKYCFGHGIHKYWHDVGITNSKGGRQRCRFVLRAPSDNAYKCNVCQRPKHLPDAPQ